MENKNLKITLAHLYPDLLNLYGDIGNIITLKNRCEWRGIELEIEEIHLKDKIKEHDMYFIGGGQDQQQEDVAYEMFRNKWFFTRERDKGAVFLGICGGYQLFGHYYQPHNKDRLRGISIMDAYTVAGDKRFIGNVTAQTEFTEPQTLVGFENHSGLTYLQGDTKPLAKVLTGKGNNGEDFTEGGRYKNVFGTYLHGSFLPKNPHFADYMIKLALEKKYDDEFELAKLDDSIEIMTHNSLTNKPY